MSEVLSVGVSSTRDGYFSRLNEQAPLSLDAITMLSSHQTSTLIVEIVES